MERCIIALLHTGMDRDLDREFYRDLDRDLITDLYR